MRAVRTILAYVVVVEINNMYPSSTWGFIETIGYVPRSPRPWNRKISNVPDQIVYEIPMRIFQHM